ncbi:MAG: SUMF1/EgtB/PvdO family nonheme iron enzyme [Thermoguttaceae bacterium]|nr:SUMF1/EgtB/PvdO family nonheme iron enzyme [Thermoguttaceae bacterium]
MTDIPSPPEGFFMFQRHDLKGLWLGCFLGWLFLAPAYLSAGEEAAEAEKPAPPEDITVTVKKVPWLFIGCPAGTFQMGSPAEEPLRGDDEPLHEVTISEPFWILQTEVTQGQWKSVMKKLPHPYYYSTYPVHPSWNDAREFIDVLNQGDYAPEGLVFDLPTEAEWEYACRAGTLGPWGGAESIAPVAWYQVNSGKALHAVATKAPNAWKLYNTLGNVAEWCSDWYGPLSSDPATDPTGPAEGTMRVLRGGSFLSTAGRCRCAARWKASPDNNRTDIGLRLVLRRGTKPAPPAARPKPISVTIDGIVYKFLGCPAGSFTMGTPLGSYPRSVDEAEHEVTFTSEFWLQETEVTRRLWDAVMKQHHNTEDGGEYLPIDRISWEEALLFIDTLNSEGVAPPGYRFDFPTEAQWEYACRAGSRLTETARKKIARQCWYQDNSGGTPRQVKRRRPNAWGFYDMLGNVSEWCRDRLDTYPAGSVVDPKGPSSGPVRVHRGGCARDTLSDCRAERRAGLEAVKASPWVGLRLALVKDTAPPTQPAEATESAEGTESSAAAELPQPKTVTIVGVPYLFIGCPAGEFQMGSPEDEAGHTADQIQKTVAIDQEFWMLEIEVPQDLWYNIMLTLPSAHQQVASSSSTLTVEPPLPVESVSWENCRQFIEELNSSAYVPTGFYFDLPTEAQWEYACRAGNSASVPDEELDLIGWYRDNSEGATHPSKEKKPNKWGFYDMLGNVSEWCLDSAEAGGSAKVYRGGSWGDFSRDCRPAARKYLAPTARSVNIGLRLVLNHETPAETEEAK